jgi:DNA topoisomerase-3
LRGELEFLFIAPERLSVPGFLELLARRPPALVAVDEAHCISHWGHDFRPEYRMLGQRLPALRRAPVLALTATATPRVQEDIETQLQLRACRRFVHGFRRDNLAIEVIEEPRPSRVATVLRLLREAGRRPAIVYAPTRKEAEAAASAISVETPAAAYHAGMSAGARDHVQKEFLDGALDVVVATIAFGMGVDKSDVRTVVNLALPASLEAYYQEIGRAGRDGQPARAVLLHSFGDRRQHEFFLAKNHPEPKVLESIFRRLGPEAIERAALEQASKLGKDQFGAALEKLWIHGGARISAEECVSRGDPDWRRRYAAQREHQRRQLEDVARFADAHGCRMLHILRHFGDQADSGRPCGLCDVCARDACVAQVDRPPGKAELEALERMLEELRRGRRAMGALFGALVRDRSLDRRSFEALVGALARSGLVSIEEASFETGGRTVAFRRVALTTAGKTASTEALGALSIPVVRHHQSSRKRRRAPELGAKADPALAEALKKWRLAEARRARIPAFRVMTDRVLERIAAEKPASESALLGIQGVGQATVKKYGQEILRRTRG